jgi:hypothetical protein
MPGQILINWWAVIVSGVLSFVLGGIWYSVFSRPWMALNGFSEETLSGGQSSSLLYVGAFLTYLVAVAVLAILMAAAGAQGALLGLVFGALVSVGLIATVSLNTYMFSGRPFRLFLIDLGYPVVALSISGVILGVWR